MKQHSILCLDFDGVLHAYTSKWTQYDEIHDGPVPGAMEFLLAANERFHINIFSSRSSWEDGIKAMKHWLIGNLAKHWEEQGAAEVDILTDAAFDWVNTHVSWPDSKPPAFLTIDDRALTFTGVWPAIEELLAFKPWNKKGPQS